jgi:dCMP deaminase
MNDLDYLRYAYTLAQSKATDPSTQNGAIIVDANGVIVAEGANHFPTGVIETVERWERPLKYKFVEHAERNAIYDAVRRGVPTEGLTMYAAWAACADCARAIIQSGIKEVVTHHNPVADMRFGLPASPTWLEEIKVALVLFEESGVRIRWFEEQLGAMKIRFNGSYIDP